MFILLPPSEGKAVVRRGRPTDWDALSLPALTPTRLAVADALAQVSAAPDALHVLGVGESLGAEVAANLDWRTAPAAPAEKVYDGVLFDAFDVAGLQGTALRRARSSVRISSPLHGMVRLTDRIAPYRLGPDVQLPGLGVVRSVWRAQLAAVMDSEADDRLVVDLRSGSYRSWWRPVTASAWVTVDVPGASHFAKFTRGLVARRLCEAGKVPTRPQHLVDLLANYGAELVAPGRPGQPWALTVAAQH
ncbi:YaaA family protein [Propionibacteriaceae bacterium G1746]|uniref:YaaA family protein n=1 Tax=Aestuariimicrobium sp. G57 TaxID=3418485 RepID=UPI003C1880AF